MNYRGVKMRSLSDRGMMFAYCSQCKEHFEDDIIMYGSIYCPNVCGFIVERGIKPEGIKYKFKCEGWRFSTRKANVERDSLNETCTEGGDSETNRTV